MSYVLISRTSDENTDRTREDWIVDDDIASEGEGVILAADPGRVNGNDEQVAASTFDIFEEEVDDEIVEFRSSIFSLDFLDNGDSGFALSTLSDETSGDGRVFSGPGLGNNPEFEQIGFANGDLTFALDETDWGRVSNIEVFIDSEDLADASGDGSGFRSLTIENFKDARIKIGDGQAVDPSLLQSSYSVNVFNAKSGQFDFSEAAAGINLLLTLSSDGAEGQNSFVIEGSAFRDVMVINPGDLSDVPEDGVTVINDGSLTLVTADLGAGSDFFDGRGVAAELHVEAGDGNDIVAGGSGDDFLSGGSGFDLLLGGPGADVLDGGPGAFGADFDTAFYGLADSGISVDLAAGVGTRGEAEGDVLIDIEGVTGSNFDDVIRGDDNQNSLSGGNGDDQLYGAAGSDFLQGDGGNDYLHGGDGTDNLLGGPGDDILDGGGGSRDFLQGGEGADTLIANEGTINSIVYPRSPAGITINLETGDASGGNAEGDVLVGEFQDVGGSSFDDVITGNSGDNGLSGGSGNDTLIGGGGNDSLDGGAGNDILDGGAGDDNLSGSSGEDILTGGPGADRLRGGDDDDKLEGGEGADRLEGGDGDDELNGGVGDDRLEGGLGHDILNGGTGTDNLFGGAGDDVLNGGADNDFLNGDDGNDFLNGGDGVDSLNGGAGDDVLDGGGGFLDVLDGGPGADTLIANEGTINRLSYVFSSEGVNVDLEAGTGSGGEAEGDILVGEFRDVFGSDFDDVLTGSSGDNLLAGRSGNDILMGGSGNDTLDGGAGDDILEGGAGSDSLVSRFGDDILTGGAGGDQFFFRGDAGPAFLAQAGDDVITDFDPLGGDILFLQDTGFASLADLIAAGVLSDSPEGAVLQYSDEASVTLLGVSVSDLSENDFTFTNFNVG